ncbi:DUF2550 domain-containing protein [Gordonia otitidis]|uniref:DUF2550 family protein n=1 Tax=Gordonia otitidis (strain DSM 44809 / CCUG 52243 / JCM 12355 / NBRC 100426 / IFM 10032) TaxID=1108044 RepID=H5TSU0_GORO1|nr:DUF2550 domain-containing protein [Gordonia otitidis]UEA59533.1 DUF2550 domain-containing protein [Gordonia otitidis]GAB36548.1 hypothetical protein GOOTI_227_00150 [Gordonia otitidis NBRC 100426]
MTVVVVLLILLVLALVVCGLLGYRLQQLRSAGTAALLRELPADFDEGWRHGSVHYGDDSLRYFRLSSLRPGPSRSFPRHGIEIVGRRCAAGSEGVILDGMTILHVREDRDGEEPREYELALTPDGVTAFQAWLEAGAPQRSQRRRSA